MVGVGTRCTSGVFASTGVASATLTASGAASTDDSAADVTSIAAASDPGVAPLHAASNPIPMTRAHPAGAPLRITKTLLPALLDPRPRAVPSARALPHALKHAAVYARGGVRRTL